MMRPTGILLLQLLSLRPHHSSVPGSMKLVSQLAS